jgi:hypothetical protein
LLAVFRAVFFAGAFLLEVDLVAVLFFAEADFFAEVDFFAGDFFAEADEPVFFAELFFAAVLLAFFVAIAVLPVVRPCSRCPWFTYAVRRRREIAIAATTTVASNRPP